MNQIEELTEDQFVSSFLLGELSSTRFGAKLQSLLKANGWPDALLTHPQFDDPVERQQRLDLLRLHRDYGEDRKLFEGFPEGVAWSRWLIPKSMLWHVRYIDYSYWNVLSGGTRSPVDAASRIRQGVTAFDVSNDGFLQAAAALSSGTTFHELILVRSGSDAPLVVLEGHLRLTTYALVPHSVADEIVVIVGEHPAMADWACY